MALSDAAAKNAKPGKKMYKLTDEYGLYLQVNPAGTVYLPHHRS
ncbi:Arm DNA-binding domain-containing protein [Morganella morganii]